MRIRSWIVAAVATAGVVAGSALYVDELETGHVESGGGLRAEPRLSAPVGVKAADKAADKVADKVDAVHECVGTRSGPSGTGSPGDSPDDTPFDRTLTRIDELAAGDHADVYTGMSVDRDHDTADIWRIPSAAFDTAACDAAEKGVKLRIHAADADRRTLDALADRISEDMNRWDGTFILRLVGVDERGFVRVGVDDPKKAEPLVTKEFGSRHIKVTYMVEMTPDAG